MKLENMTDFNSNENRNQRVVSVFLTSDGLKDESAQINGPGTCHLIQDKKPQSTAEGVCSHLTLGVSWSLLLMLFGRLRKYYVD